MWSQHVLRNVLFFSNLLSVIVGGLRVKALTALGRVRRVKALTALTARAALPRCRLRRGARLPGEARLRGKGSPAAVGCKTSRGRAWQVKSVQVTSGQHMEDQDKSGQVKTGHVT